MECRVCLRPKSKFVFQNKTVCLKCDELLFDMEIECEEGGGAAKDKQIQTILAPKKTSAGTRK